MINIYNWIEKHPNTSIAAAIKRIKKIFDEADEILIGFSGGKDSSLTIQLCILELKRRKELNDPKWSNKKLWVNFMNSEWLYSDVISFVNSFLKENKNYINCFYKCLQLGWNSGVTFGDDRLVSWDLDKKKMWITDMPKSSEVGTDVITNENINNVNLVRLKDLSTEIQKRRLKDSKLTYVGGEEYVPNFGLGNTKLGKEYDCWTFSGQDEDHEQETFSLWLLKQFSEGTKLYNLVSIRADESFDRYTILKQCNFETGQYGRQSYNNSILYVASPIFDMKTKDVWRCMSACDFSYSNIYEKMFEAGVPIGKQRVASLLHTCAVRNINQLQALEPLIYRRISARFQNIDFISSFVKSGYYKIGKPSDSQWNGRNHIKAGVSEEDNKKLSDNYEYFLNKYNIPFERENDIFKLQDPNSFKNLKNIASPEDLKEIEKLSVIHFDWKCYCLYLLNTASEPARTNWRKKMITDILKLRFQASSCPLSTKSALMLLSELPDELTLSVTDDVWHENDWRVYDSNLKSKKELIAVVRYPQESLEAEAYACIKHIYNNKDMEIINNTPTLKKLCERWNNGYIYSPEELRIAMVKNKTLPKKEVSDDFWENIERGASIWFRENIHSTSSWKRFAAAIYRGDFSLKYLGFVPTYKERMARRIINK